MDRTVQALVGFAKRKLEMDEKFKDWEQKTPHASADEKEKKRKLFQQHRPEHPACQVSGHLMVNRVPGNFHIEAKSKNHNLNGTYPSRWLTTNWQESGIFVVTHSMFVFFFSVNTYSRDD